MNTKSYNNNTSQDNPSGSLSLPDLLDIPVFQNLSDSFYKLTRLPTAILDLTGKILIASGWQKICTDFHRKHSGTASRCLESDTSLASRLSKGKKYNIYKCKNGLIDVAAPILIENIHVGNIFAGQFLFEEPDLNFFAGQADEFGFDKALYLEALANVPVLTDDEIKTAIEYLAHLTVVIGSAGLDRKRLLDLNRNLEQQIHDRTLSLRKSEKFSESLISSLPGVMYVFDEVGRFKSWNQNLEEITGYSKKDLLEMRPLDFIVPEDKPHVENAIRNVLKQGSATVEARLSTFSGNVIPYLFTGIKFIQEGTNYVIGVGLDISDRVRSEKEKANLIIRLQEAFEKVKQLSGLLPICASCKKIRDDKGYWNQIESYIKQHSEAEFSHCICPECMEKHYGDQEWYSELNKGSDSS